MWVHCEINALIVCEKKEKENEAVKKKYIVSVNL
jgi:hypothetical protein